ncbi:hypothetical protein RIVM261_079080 [Rivularia sp. IAM M-261]|nr:hypothetical protein RIVM261_079080 [Rivularia sp. IAM M-261]
MDKKGKYSEAEPLYIQALELAKRILGKNHPKTVTYQQNLSNFWSAGIENGHFSIETLRENPLFIEIKTELAGE